MIWDELKGGDGWAGIPIGNQYRARVRVHQVCENDRIAEDADSGFAKRWLPRRNQLESGIGVERHAAVMYGPAQPFLIGIITKAFGVGRTPDA